MSEPLGEPAAEDDQRRVVNLMLPQARLSHDQLWMRYFTLGGVAGPLELEAYLQGLMPLPRLELWVPLLDGVERLGVLRVAVEAESDLRDPGLRAQCRWLAALLGHLISSMNTYGDVIDTARRTRRLGVGAELLWALLPPLTAGVGGFVISGMVEPSLQARGDAFDYGLTADAAALAIFDAMGHDLQSSLIAATALAAYRSARHSGGGLEEQADAVDATIADRFPDAFCTGVMADLDLRTGRLRYLATGHPAPLVYRAGKVLRCLEGGRRLPFGLGDAQAQVSEAVLQPSDWLALYTDGIAEARDATGTQFGDQRLIDFLVRAAADGQPPPETARRLTQAVLAHQQGDLQDDATVLLASWNHHDFADYPSDLGIPDPPSTRFERGRPA